MRSKILNALTGAMNLLFGCLVLFFMVYMPNLARASEEEIIVVNQLYSYIFILTIIVAVINFIVMLFNKDNKVFVLGYVIALIATSFYFLNILNFSILYILASAILIIQSLRENLVTKSNTFFLVIVSIIISSIVIVGVNCYTYKDKVKKLYQRENIGQTIYEEDYFKYISELNLDDLYINVEKDGKWGYINTKGEVVIDYKYDYASCFVQITKNDKNFDVALVSKEGNSYLILKNERVVFSYKNQIPVGDYEKQFEKLREIYTETLDQSDNFDDKIIKPVTSNINKIKSYEGQAYKYPFNNDYDIYITVSQSGMKNRYELVNKNNNNVKLSIDCDYLDFDENNLYVFSNGYLPFYKTSENLQGYYTDQTKRIELQGNMQILDFIDDLILIKDYNVNSIYFINQNGEIVSPKYKDIYIMDNGYIVKNQSNKFMLVDKSFNKTTNNEFDIIDTTLLSQGLLICGNMPSTIEFNEIGYPTNIDYYIMKTDGNIINKDPFQNLYTVMYKYSDNYESFINNITDIKYYFVGDRFYNN